MGLINLIIIRENSRFFIPSSGMKTGANGMENRSNVVTKNVPYQILFSIPLFFSYNYFFTPSIFPESSYIFTCVSYFIKGIVQLMIGTTNGGLKE